MGVYMNNNNEYENLIKNTNTKEELEKLKNELEQQKLLKPETEMNSSTTSTSNEKAKVPTLSKPGIPKFMVSNEDDGYSNIVLLSIALIIIGIIVFMIIFA